MEKLWVYPEAADEKLVQHLSQQINIHPIIAKFLIKMDINTPEKVDEFFNPSLSKLLDPFLMRDMDKAVTRIRKAIEGKERILVYGDYDVDGTTAVSILHSFIANQPGVKMLPVEERQLEYRIPDRYSEGYGLNFEAVNFAKEHHFSLIITLDCGIRGNSEIELANQYGIDIIVGDHHRSGDELPNAFAILDPKIDGETYPYKDLSGAGIAFKIVEAYCKKYDIDEAKIYRYLDLCVMSIASDVVPITGENRILAYYGLKRINTKPRPAIEAILKHALIFRNQDPKSPIFFFDKPLFFDRELTINDLVFLIGPRINAAGRMESGKNAVRLLETEDNRLENFSAEIEAYNNERKELDRKATDDAIEVLDRLAEDFHHQTQKTTVVFNEEWHKGIIGIVASRLVEKYFRPTIVFT
ncbi:MAG: DHH family phosphoesterase, partial [Bacteroidales bacterium]|nr:DHH family phosphoesterase [Bacteroidales bacterium]